MKLLGGLFIHSASYIMGCLSVYKKNKMNHDLIQEILLIKEPYNLIGCNHSRLKYRDKNFPWSIAKVFKWKLSELFQLVFTITSNKKLVKNYNYLHENFFFKNYSIKIFSKKTDPGSFQHLQFSKILLHWQHLLDRSFCNT